MRARKLLLRTIVAAVCLTGAIAIYELLAGSYDDTSWRILATTTAVSFFGLLGVPAGSVQQIVTFNAFVPSAATTGNCASKQFLQDKDAVRCPPLTLRRKPNQNTKIAIIASFTEGRASSMNSRAKRNQSGIKPSATTLHKPTLLRSEPGK